MNVVRRLAPVFMISACLTTPANSQRRPDHHDTRVVNSWRSPSAMDLRRAFVTPALAVRMDEPGRLGMRALTPKARLAPLSWQSAGGSWIRRHPRLFGALVGFGVGCPVGAAQVGGSQDDFFNALDEFACPVLGGIGAAAGAIIGSAVSR
jgi:hypothetical protein